MCFSGIGQIVFGIIMIACFVLTCASMFSDNWRTFKNNAEDTIKSGIFSFNCHIPGSNGAAQSCDSSEWWNSLKTWEKVTVVAMCLAVATELLCLAWNLFACFACCCKKYVIHPLTLFATLVAIFLAVGVIVYGVNNKDALDNVNFNNGEWKKTEVGYSFYLAVVALVLAVVDIFVAGLTVCLAEKCC
ncbi:unnamed protein product, partial [Mesorhabditis belari]|uniref:Uncharacterized protein n=1 Tax=Mesorhabditis belari TaxID=2138241 RepID=A0AAF3EV09_9BILA